MSSENPTYAARFMERLAKLPRGNLAVLKRAAGGTIADSRAAAAIFYRIYPTRPDDRDEEIYFLAATLYGLNPATFRGNFGATLRALVARGVSSEAMGRRVTILLDSELDLIDGFRPGGGELAYRLRQLTKQAAAQGVGVDWPQLIEDLRWWTHPAKRTQKAWARAFFSETPVETPVA